MTHIPKIHEHINMHILLIVWVTYQYMYKNTWDSVKTTFYYFLPSQRSSVRGFKCSMYKLDATVEYSFETKHYVVWSIASVCGHTSPSLPYLTLILFALQLSSFLSRWFYASLSHRPVTTSKCFSVLLVFFFLGVPVSWHLWFNYKMENRRVTQLANIIALKVYGPSDLIKCSLDVRWHTRNCLLPVYYAFYQDTYYPHVEHEIKRYTRPRFLGIPGLLILW